MEWRFNNHNNSYMFLGTLKRILRTEPMTYRQLVDGKKIA